MQRLTIIVLMVITLFGLASVTAAKAAAPPETISPYFRWNNKNISDGGEISVALHNQATTSVSFSFRQGSSTTTAIATGTEMFVDIYKGTHGSSTLYRSFRYIHNNSQQQYQLGWQQPGRYFIAVYTDTDEPKVLNKAKQADFYKDMRPFFTTGDTSGLTASGPNLLWRFIPGTVARAAPNNQLPGPKGFTDTSIKWGKKSFTVTVAADQHSSVAFLPGFQASRLHFDTETPLGYDRLWEPEHNDDLRDMMFTNGSSLHKVWVGDTIESINYFEAVQSKDTIYQKFFSFLDTLKNKEVIADWKSLPYDWRRLQTKNVTGPIKQLSDQNATTSYRMLKRITRLASSSDTGQVTIIGHSNGGLVGKLLISELRKQGKAHLVDQFVMVGTPQVGTPKTIGAMLHGLGQEYLEGLIAKKETARDLSRTIPGAYGLLPSPAYFQHTDQAPIEFGPGPATQQFRQAYGPSIDTYAEFRHFLTGQAGRSKAVGINQPAVVDKKLLHQTQSIYDKLRSWRAPTSTEVTQIVGWGLPTVTGLEYFDKGTFCLEQLVGKRCSLRDTLGVRPIITTRGDGTVVGVSADNYEGSRSIFLAMDTLNDKYPKNKFEHADIMEAQAVHEVFGNIIKGDAISYSAAYLTKKRPSNQNELNLLISAHSPVSIEVQNGNSTTEVVAEQNNLTVTKESISQSSYINLGESTYVTVPADKQYDITASGTGSGTATIAVAKTVSDSGDVKASSTFSGVSVTTSTTASLDVSTKNLASSSLKVDANGDGSAEKTLSTNRRRHQQEKSRAKEKRSTSNKDNTEDTTSRSGGFVHTTNEDELSGTDGRVLGVRASSSASAHIPVEAPTLEVLIDRNVGSMNQTQLVTYLSQLSVRLRAILKILR